MREWLTVIISLLIIGIFLDGLRRMRRARRESLRMSRNVRRFDNEGLPEQGPDAFSEPRVVGYRDTRDAENMTKSMRESFVKSRVTVGAPRRIPEQVALSLEEPVPMLMDSVEEAGQEDPWESESDGADRYTDQAYDDADDNLDDDFDDEKEEFTEPADNDSELAETDEPSLGSMDDLADSQSEALRSSEPVTKANAPGRKPDVARPAHSHNEPDEVLVMNLMAPAGRQFDGAELLQALLDQGLRFGSMNIFHRHQSADGSGPVQFSLANMVVPGTFNLSTMAEFSTPGVSMFLSLPNEDDSLAAFDSMAETAKTLAARLGGELKDENRSVMTRQTIEHCRQRVIEFERKQRLMQHSQ